MGRENNGIDPQEATPLGRELVKSLRKMDVESAGGFHLGTADVLVTRTIQIEAATMKPDTPASRGQLLRFVAQIPTGLVGIEACGGTHFWGLRGREAGTRSEATLQSKFPFLPSEYLE